jgi:hypothetical protein
MTESDILGAKGKRCTVCLEACDKTDSAKTRVKALLRDRTGVQVVSRVFDSLDEALAFASTLYQEAA